MEEELKKKKGVKWWEWTILAVLIVILSGVIVYGKKNGLAWSDVKAIFKNEAVSTSTAEVTKTKTTEKAAASTIPADWKTYTNSEVGFSFRYPSSWKDIQLNVIDNSKDGHGGKFITSSDGKNGIINFDPGKIFDFSADARTYIPGPPTVNTSYNQIKIDPNWTKEEISKNMGFSELIPKILATKKLSNKSVLIADYENIECSEAFRIKVVTPLNDIYPNLEISINEDFSQDPLLIANENALRAKGEPDCDSLNPYQQIADKIIAGNYSSKIASDIQTAQMIADSLVVDETLTWKTYTNKDYGFSFKYPSNYNVDNVGATDAYSARPNIFDNNSKSVFDIIVNYVHTNADGSKQANSGSLDDYVSSLVNHGNFLSAQKITFAGQSAYEGASPGITSEYAILLKKNDNFITIIASSVEQKKDLSEIQKLILASFEFTK